MNCWIMLWGTVIWHGEALHQWIIKLLLRIQQYDYKLQVLIVLFYLFDFQVQKKWGCRIKEDLYKILKQRAAFKLYLV